MRKLVMGLFAMGALAGVAFAGTETFSGKEMKQVAPPPCPQWFADNEWNVSLWGTYAFTGTESNRTNAEYTEDLAEFGSYDRFLGDDHAWGGGIDAKYFFRRYFGVGIEGFALAGRGSHINTNETQLTDEYAAPNDHLVGGVLGTLTLRYPIPCTRFAPYVWAGGGGIFGGSNDKPSVVFIDGQFFGGEVNNESESKGMGQFGGGMEVRITPHIGWISDFSWNVVDGPNNNFGMVRTGVNFAF
jgi:hypothetical protein